MMQPEMSFSDVLFKPNGRIGQGQFWGGWGALVGANIVAGFIPFIGGFISIGLIYVGCCVYGKRLHDMGKSAWLHAIPWAISLVMTVIAIAMVIPLFMELVQTEGEVEPDFGAMMALLGPAIFIILLSNVMWLAYSIWVGVSAPQAGANKYGPSLDGAVLPDTFV